MKEITRIHLARTPFSVEIDAKKALEKYLDAIQKTLSADDDTIREIEARIVEILAERGVTNDSVITAQDVEAIEAKLGSPIDFADEVDVDSVKLRSNEKRLMRDTDRGLLGGVCAGIANYFGLNVMWVRLAAIVLTFVSFGMSVIVYFVLWLAIPPAKTAAEKLQMRGESVTLAAIKSEAREMLTVREGSKPLVIALRVLLGLGCVAVGITAIGFILVAVLVRRPLFDASMHGIATGGALATLGAAYIAAIVAGLLFAVLMALAAYASFAWTINKKLLISGSIVIVLGLTSFATGIGLGVSGAGQVNNQIEQRKTTETITASQLAKDLRAVTLTSPDNLTVEYQVTSAAPHIEVQYLRGQKKPQVTITRDDDHATITATQGETCDDSFMPCSGYDQVIIYGPALATLSTQTDSASYYPTSQSKLAVNIAANAGLSIEGGQIASLNATAASEGWLSTEDSNVTAATFTTAAGATSSFGALDTLAITTPKLCNDEKATVTYQSVNILTVNDERATSVHNDYPCVAVNQ